MQYLFGKNFWQFQTTIRRSPVSVRFFAFLGIGQKKRIYQGWLGTIVMISDCNIIHNVYNYMRCLYHHLIYRLSINYFFALFCTFLSYVIVCQVINVLSCVKIHNYWAKITRLKKCILFFCDLVSKALLVSKIKGVKILQNIFAFFESCEF